MARITIDGIDQLMAGLNREGSALRPRIERALTLAAEAVADALRTEAASSFKAPTGELAGTVAADSRVTHEASMSAIEVYARGDYTGRRGKPRRAETVAFVVEYGRTGQAANPWNRRARRKSAKRVNTIIAEQLGGGAATVGAGKGGL